MPFKSEAQRKFLFAKHPEVARKFAAHTPEGAKLPEHVGQSTASKRRKQALDGIKNARRS